MKTLVTINDGQLVFHDESENLKPTHGITKEYLDTLTKLDKSNLTVLEINYPNMVMVYMGTKLEDGVYQTRNLNIQGMGKYLEEVFKDIDLTLGIQNNFVMEWG